MWTNLVEAVGLVPGPNEKGQHWIRNFLQKIHDEESMKEIEQINSEKNEMDPTADPRRGSKGYHLYPRFTFAFEFIFPFSFVSQPQSLKHHHLRRDVMSNWSFGTVTFHIVTANQVG